MIAIKIRNFSEVVFKSYWLTVRSLLHNWRAEFQICWSVFSIFVSEFLPFVAQWLRKVFAMSWAMVESVVDASGNICCETDFTSCYLSMCFFTSYNALALPKLLRCLPFVAQWLRKVFAISWAMVESVGDAYGNICCATDFSSCYLSMCFLSQVTML